MAFQTDSVTHLINLLNPFRTPGGDVFIHRPFREDETSDAEGGPTADEGKDNPKQQESAVQPDREIPLASQDADEIISALFGPHTKRGVPNKTELQGLKNMISGHASMRPRRNARFLGSELIQQKPLAQAVIEIAKQGPTRDTPRNWLAKVNNIIRVKGIVVKDPSWPTTEDALGHQFGDLIPIVALCGVRLERHENDRPRTWSAYLETDAPLTKTESVGSVGKVTALIPLKHASWARFDTLDASDTTGENPGIDFTFKEQEMSAVEKLAVLANRVLDNVVAKTSNNGDLS